MSENTTYPIRPYARLLTMLGEQLIKDEKIALIEIIKNAYDADANWVKITFKGFGDNYEIKESSKIIIEDSGNGMTRDIILKHWLNPATPVKIHVKEKNPITEKGRVIQGEKGIGRFALFKLGKKIQIVTKTAKENLEHVIDYDFSIYDNEFLEVNGEEKDLFLDELSVSVIDRKPEIIKEKEIILATRKINSPNHGTYIEITDLIGSWSDKKVQSVYNDVARLEPIFYDIGKEVEIAAVNEFKVWIYKDDKQKKYHEDFIEKLNYLLKYRSVLKIENGLFDSNNGKFTYKENGAKKELKLDSSEVTGLTIYKNRFKDAGDEIKNRIMDCGPFKFGFYIFDFNFDVPEKFKLDKDDKTLIKSHRIYLYRDGIRVYPYGEQDDDWLRIDQYRGTISAGMFLSNDQVVGYVNITQKENAKLKDKTNREGLIEEGHTTEDFISLIQIFLAYVRRGPYARYQKNKESKKDLNVYKLKRVQSEFEKLKNLPGIDKQTLTHILNAEKLYLAEYKYLDRRAEISEELAGVGLSVETASHDIMKMMESVFINIDGLISDLISKDEIDKRLLLNELKSIRGGISFVEAQLRDIQLLFTSSKQRRRSIRVKEIIEKVERIYKRLLEKDSIQLTINSYGSPLIAKTTDAVLLQLLLNLFDNSVYWLEQTSIKKKQILITLDGQNCEMIFSDNGPGVNPDDEPYIFEPFYSGKGEEGRGLGLYIARQLLERSGYSIELGKIKSKKILNGANFVVNFIGED